MDSKPGGSKGKTDERRVLCRKKQHTQTTIGGMEDIVKWENKMHA